MLNQGKIHVHAPPINSGLIQVRDSIDSLFAKEYIPLQPQFMFKDRGVQGGGRINWR